MNLKHEEVMCASGIEKTILLLLWLYSRSQQEHKAIGHTSNHNDYNSTKGLTAGAECRLT